jgi:ABC-2 type transport system permease protein
MNKILIIIQREYLTRVRKKSFIILSLIGPVFWAALMIIPAWVATLDGEQKVINVIDESGLFKDRMRQLPNLFFMYSSLDLATEKKQFAESKYDGLLYIPSFDIYNPSGIQFYYQKSVSLQTKKMLETVIAKDLETAKLSKSGIPKSKMDSIFTKINIETINITENGEKKSNTEVATAVGYAGAMIIYIFIFLFGTQVMRGAMEEKTNRIIEVMISSVKPFQLMMGKIIGVAGVALTQFLIWIVLGFGISAVTGIFFQNKMTQIPQMQLDEAVEEAAIIGQYADIMTAVDSMNLPFLLACLLFYFVGGYLLYAALFAAIGAAVDSETDSQQLVMPVSMPLILSFIIASYVIKEPDSPLAFWSSVIPFTSPLIMMVRLPLGVPWYELLLSGVFLVAGFIFTTWVAARIYRVGVLMYGKKVTFKELAKWFFYYR